MPHRRGSARDHFPDRARTRREVTRGTPFAEALHGDRPARRQRRAWDRYWQVNAAIPSKRSPSGRHQRTADDRQRDQEGRPCSRFRRPAPRRRAAKIVGNMIDMSEAGEPERADCGHAGGDRSEVRTGAMFAAAQIASSRAGGRSACVRGNAPLKRPIISIAGGPGEQERAGALAHTAGPGCLGEVDEEAPHADLGSTQGKSAAMARGERPRWRSTASMRSGRRRRTAVARSSWERVQAISSARRQTTMPIVDRAPAPRPPPRTAMPRVRPAHRGDSRLGPFVRREDEQPADDRTDDGADAGRRTGPGSAAQTLSRAPRIVRWGLDAVSRRQSRSRSVQSDQEHARIARWTLCG